MNWQAKVALILLSVVAMMVVHSLIGTPILDIVQNFVLIASPLTNLSHRETQTSPNSKQFLTQRPSALKLPSIAFSHLRWKTTHILSR